MSEYGHRRDTGAEAVRPPEPVWLDLALVYPVAEDCPLVVPGGRDLQAEVPAEVTLRDVATTGHELVYVRYDAPHDGEFSRTAQWVLRWAVRPREDGQPLRAVSPTARSTPS